MRFPLLFQDEPREKRILACPGALYEVIESICIAFGSRIQITALRRDATLRFGAEGPGRRGLLLAGKRDFGREQGAQSSQALTAGRG
jgi:hypothetical protein